MCKMLHYMHFPSIPTISAVKTTFALSLRYLLQYMSMKLCKKREEKRKQENERFYVCDDFACIPFRNISLHMSKDFHCFMVSCNRSTEQCGNTIIEQIIFVYFTPSRCFSESNSQCHGLHACDIFPSPLSNRQRFIFHSYPWLNATK